MTDPIRAALERLIARLDETTDPNGPVPAWSDSFYAARAALAHPAPPAEGEVLRFPFTVEQLRDQWNAQADEFNQWESLGLDEQIEWAQACAANLLAQRHPAPVLVSDRPWERDGWCDESGRCWCFTPRQDFDGHLTFHSRWILSIPDANVDTHCLPAHALPLPAGEVQP